jgi:hypothetical protein
LKLALSKNLSLLDEQSFQNDGAKVTLQNFLDNVRRGIAQGEMDVMMPY